MLSVFHAKFSKIVLYAECRYPDCRVDVWDTFEFFITMQTVKMLALYTQI